MNVFRWLTRQSFGVNLLAAILFIFLLGALFFASLGIITKHGETIKVPEVVGQSADKATELLKTEGFNVEVEDSAYVDSLPPLTVLRQQPEGNFVVKVNRTIYLTLNKQEAPETAMPNLVNLSFRSAELDLQSLKLNMGDTIYKPDIAKNAVLAQLYNNKPIQPGTMIPEGSRISLVLGDGIGNQANPVPNLVGLTFMQARDLLSASNLGLGVVLFDGPITDTDNAYVFRQMPPPKTTTGQVNSIYAGESIDMWISQTQKDTSGLPLNQP
jgi:eukaryotic-like serine/threonine-protein kinase